MYKKKWTKKINNMLNFARTQVRAQNVQKISHMPMPRMLGDRLGLDSSTPRDAFNMLSHGSHCTERTGYGERTLQKRCSSGWFPCSFGMATLSDDRGWGAERHEEPTTRTVRIHWKIRRRDRSHSCTSLRFHDMFHVLLIIFFLSRFTLISLFCAFRSMFPANFVTFRDIIACFSLSIPFSRLSVTLQSLGPLHIFMGPGNGVSSGSLLGSTSQWHRKKLDIYNPSLIGVLIVDQKRRWPRRSRFFRF